MRSAGNFLHVAWYGIAWQARSQFVDDLPPERCRNFKMRRSSDAIELVQIVRRHPQFDQTLAQRRLGGDRVVNAREQHGLVEKYGAGVHQFGNGVRDVRIKFIRMIGVQHNDRRESRLCKHSYEFMGDAFRNYDRQPRVNSQPPEMRNRFQPVDERGERRVDKRQRIAAAKNDLG